MRALRRPHRGPQRAAAPDGDALGPAPAVKTIADFDFSFQPSVKREKLESLHTLSFLERRDNVVLLDPPEAGKRTSR